MSITTLHGDCRQVLPTMPERSVQCVVSSPPYYGLRKYGDDPREIGQESTPAEYVAALVEVFRQVRRVLRDDGTVWLNLGDSYSGSWGNYGGQNRGQGTQREIVKGSLPSPGYDGRESERPASSVTPDLRNCLQSSIEGHVFSLRGRYTLTVTAQRSDVLDAHQLAPDGELAPLFGVKRIFIKQRDNNLCQVLNLLDSEGCLWVGRSVTLARVGQAQTDVIFDASDYISIVVSEHDLNHQTALSVPILSSTTEHAQMPLAVEESSEPITESIRDGKPVRDAVALDALGESCLQVDLVNDLVATGERLVATTEGLRNFRVTKASQQHLALTMLEGCFDLAVSCVGHLFASNEYGSLIRYTELYDKAYRLSNRLKAKQLIGIPWMVVTALQEDGWILRSDCIWSKPNCMPESVTDRPTRAHEYVFLLAKSARYFYDAAAIAEAAQQPVGVAKLTGQIKRGDLQDLSSSSLGTNQGSTTRNKRTVWQISTQNYSGAHYATMPEALIEPCILAGSSAQACEHCGAAWVRVVERGEEPTADYASADRKNRPNHQTNKETRFSRPPGIHGYTVERKTLGFAPSCACPDNTGSAASVVLDPFGGSGTVGRVALRLQRRAVLIELNETYIAEHIDKRTDGLQVEMFV